MAYTQVPASGSKGQDHLQLQLLGKRELVARAECTELQSGSLCTLPVNTGGPAGAFRHACMDSRQHKGMTCVHILLENSRALTDGCLSTRQFYVILYSR